MVISGDSLQVTTPTLIVCGEVDWNVPVQNSDQLYARLHTGVTHTNVQYHHTNTVCVCVKNHLFRGIYATDQDSTEHQWVPWNDRASYPVRIFPTD
jgi:hypothetical protein